MTASELINKYFVKENVYEPVNIIASDHFALGCMLIIGGKVDAGLKIIAGAMTLAGCRNATHERQIRSYVRKSPAEAALMVKPHCEVEKILLKS